MPHTTVHVRIEGRVQGVGYRAWVEHAAHALNLKGWVRNRRDGTVEIVLHGPPGDVGDMLKRCETGPAAASVTGVRVMGQSDETFDSFDVRATA